MPLWLDRLRKRKLFEWTLAYLAGAWLVMQLVEVLAGRWPLPLGLQRGIDLMLVVGFFVAVTLAWYHGEKGRQRVTGPELLILATLLFIAGGLLAFLGRAEPSSQATTDSVSPRRFLAEDAPGIAVLPFSNLSGDPGQDYFVAGMHEALISSLSRIQDLRVISRTSSMRYADTDKPVPEVARELNVDAVIEGSVNPVGDRVRISVQLIDGATDGHLWAEEYDRDLRDVLVLMSQVAEIVAQHIEVVLAPQDQALLRASAPVDPRLLDLYMRGRFSYGHLTAAGLAQSVEYFEQAIRMDSTFAMGWAGLAGAHVLRAYAGLVPPEKGMSAAEQAALRAVGLNDALSLAHTALGWVRMLYDYDWDEARRQFETALDLDPNDVDALHGFGDYLTITGSAEDGLAYVRRARDNDPFSRYWGQAVVGHLLFMARFEDAVAEAHRVVEFYPESPVWMFSGRASWQLGRGEEALASFRRALARRPALLEALDAGYAEGGPEAAVRAVAEAAAEASRSSHAGSVSVALWYARVGDRDQALSWLERAFEQRAPSLIYIAVTPEVDFLHGDPGFRSILQRMGLAPRGDPTPPPPPNPRPRAESPGT